MKSKAMYHSSRVRTVPLNSTILRGTQTLMYPELRLHPRSELSGQELEHWNLRQWIETMARADILVGTPEVFRRALIEKAFINPSQFSVIVFDECHNAVGNSPMAAIMRDSVLKLPERDRPRILGLTASFVSGSTSNVASIMKKRAAMEILFHANILSPNIPVQIDDPVVDEKYKLISYPDDKLAAYKVSVESFVALVLSAQHSNIFDDIWNWTVKGMNLFLTLGAEGLRYSFLHLYQLDQSL